MWVYQFMGEIKKIALFGPQGSGKGTQAVMLGKKLSIPVLATGEFFRQEIKKGSDLGKLAEKFIKQGKLVPDVITNRVAFDELSKKKYAKGFVLDGYPRNLNQLDFLEKDFGLDLIIQLEIGDRKVLKRLGGRRICPDCGAIYHIKNKPPLEKGVCDVCGGGLVIRDDDRPEAIKRRLDIYHSRTEPILEKYKKENKLIKIDATDPIEKITRNIMEKIKKHEQDLY